MTMLSPILAAATGIGLPYIPGWYELRPFGALLRRRRRPSRFDLWEAVVA